MVRLDETALANLIHEAESSRRLRSHFILHSGHDDQVQRLVIVLRRGTYVRPHLHLAQWEMLVLIRGAADVLFFTSTGQLVERIEMSPDHTSVIQIPPGQVHGVVAMQDHTAILEVKPGPFRLNEFMDWAPAEGANDATAFVDWTTEAATGESWLRPEQRLNMSKPLK